MSAPRLVEVRRNVLKQNDVIARALRERFRESGVFVVSLVSSPGSGKTSFLERTLTDLQPRYRVAALVEAAMVQNALEGWELPNLDFLFIENVGNLVCPSSYDLGENMRLVLMSVTEGEDKPLKYPTIFNSADIAVVTKNDLAPAVEFDWNAAEKSIHSVRPGMKVFRLSAKTGEGMSDYLEFLSQQLAEQRTPART
jgi:hydrogenase nickel incorporation protein HypB